MANIIIRSIIVIAGLVMAILAIVKLWTWKTDVELFINTFRETSKQSEIEAKKTLFKGETAIGLSITVSFLFIIACVYMLIML